MEGHAQKCLVRYCELANKRVEQLYKVSNPEWTSSLTRWTVIIWRIAINLYLARIGGPDILRSVNKLARSVTKRTQESDKCLARLISYIHVKTSNTVMWETRHSIADWVCFKTPILQEILRIQHLHQVEHCAFSEAIYLFNSGEASQSRPESARKLSPEIQIRKKDFTSLVDIPRLPHASGNRMLQNFVAFQLDAIYEQKLNISVKRTSMCKEYIYSVQKPRGFEAIRNNWCRKKTLVQSQILRLL